MISVEKAREYRKALFAAFDIYKGNVKYGIEVETEAEHRQILVWYESMLTLPLELEDYKNSPSKIMKYLPQLK